jgi:hypothetical protein
MNTVHRTQKPCVKVGDKVLTGQVIAKTPGKYPSYTHASISGVVLAIEKRPIPHPSGIDGVCWWGNLLNFWFFYWVWIRNTHPTFKGITSHDLSPLNLEHSCPKLWRTRGCGCFSRTAGCRNIATK